MDHTSTPKKSISKPSKSAMKAQGSRSDEKAERSQTNTPAPEKGKSRSQRRVSFSAEVGKDEPTSRVETPSHSQPLPTSVNHRGTPDARKNSRSFSKQSLTKDKDRTGRTQTNSPLPEKTKTRPQRKVSVSVDTCKEEKTASRADTPRQSRSGHTSASNRAIPEVSMHARSPARVDHHHASHISPRHNITDSATRNLQRMTSTLDLHERESAPTRQQKEQDLEKRRIALERCISETMEKGQALNEQLRVWHAARLRPADFADHEMALEREHLRLQDMQHQVTAYNEQVGSYSDYLRGYNAAVRDAARAMAREKESHDNSRQRERGTSFGGHYSRTMLN